MGDITQLLRKSAADPAVFEELCRKVQEELASLARAHRRGEKRVDPLMETMDLVNQTFLRLVHVVPAGIKDRAHFFRLFSRTMERVLCDQAKYRNAKKRGSGRASCEVREDDWITVEQADQVLCAQEVLEEIERSYPKEARIFREFYFGGKDARDVVAILADEGGFEGVDVKEVQRALKFVGALVRERLEGGRPPGETDP